MQTPKYPEGSVYSGLIKSKSNDVGQLRGIPKSATVLLVLELTRFAATGQPMVLD